MRPVHYRNKELSATAVIGVEFGSGDIGHKVGEDCATEGEPGKVAIRRCSSPIRIF